jgi:hypothetical protein
MKGFPICALRRVLYCDHVTEDELAGACSTHGKVHRTVMGNVMVMYLLVYFGGTLILNCTNPFNRHLSKLYINSAYVTENRTRVHYKDRSW